LALYLGRLRHLSFTDGLAVVEAIESVPALLGRILQTEPLIEEAAGRIAAARSALYLGRDIHYPVALEGALKLKEIGYIQADPRCAGGRPAAPGRRAAPVARLPRRASTRLRHRQAAKPRQERDGGMI